MNTDRKWFWVVLAVAAVVIIVLIIGLMVKVNLDRAGKAGETTSAGQLTAEGTGQDAIAELIYQDGKIIHVPVADFASFIAAADGPVFVDFWADWCAPCKAAAPFVETLAEEYAGRVHVLKVDVDQAQELARKYEVQSIPLFMVIKNGHTMDQFAGYGKEIENDLRQMLEKQIG